MQTLKFYTPKAPYPDVYMPLDTFIFFLWPLCNIIWMHVHYFPNAPRITLSRLVWRDKNVGIDAYIFWYGIFYHRIMWERSEPEHFLISIQKHTMVMATILVSLFPWCILWKFKGVQPPSPTAMSRSKSGYIPAEKKHGFLFPTWCYC